MNTSLKSLTWFGGIVLLVVLAFWFFPSQEKTAQKSALDNRVLATQKLAEYLARKFPGQKALVIGNPFTQKGGERKEIYAFEEAGVRGLRKGFGKSITLSAVVFPEVRPEYYRNPDAIDIDPKTTTPLSFLVTEKSFDLLARAHSESAILVSLIGLPANLGRVEFWSQPNGPKLALLLPDLRMVGDQASIRTAFQSGKIAAAVLNNPGAPPEDMPPTQDNQTEFANRYRLVTAETIDELMRVYPQLF